MMPDSTSPVPAVASRASPAFTTSASPSGLATTVAAPFRRATQLSSVARWRAAARRSEPGGVPHSKRNSPSWGVTTVGAGRSRRTAPAPSDDQASAKSPSPSTTTGRGARATTSRALVAVASARPNPGPTTRAWNRLRSPRTSAAHNDDGRARPTTSVGAAVSWTTPGDVNRT